LLDAPPLAAFFPDRKVYQTGGSFLKMLHSVASIVFDGMFL